MVDFSGVPVVVKVGLEGYTSDYTSLDCLCRSFNLHKISSRDSVQSGDVCGTGRGNVLLVVRWIAVEIWSFQNQMILCHF